jgi:DNA polymerase
MFVGEAPGFREDEIAKPFAGAAGQYLDQLLQEINLPRESVYITNANKCRPPENRTPTRTEIKACQPYLLSEIESVHPDVIVPLGNVALEATLGEKGIMKKRGTTIVKDGITYLPTLHPAAILRNPAWESMIKADFQGLRKLLDGSDSKPKTKSYIIKSSKSLQVFLSKLVTVSTPIAFDVETWGPSEEGGLRPWQPGGIVLTCSFTWEPGTSYVLALEHPEAKWDIPIRTVYQALSAALADKKMVGHNVKFDMAWMRVKGVKLTASFDTMLAHHLLDENAPHGIKKLSRTYLGADEYEANIDFKNPYP